MENNFEIIKKGQDVFLSKYLGDEKVVKIPEEIDGNKIKGIDSECFKGCKTIEAIIVSNSVETIATNAFKGCRNLIKLALGTNIKYLEPKALNCLSKLETLYLLSKNFIYTEQDLKVLNNQTVIKSKYIPDRIQTTFNQFSHTFRNGMYIVSGWDPNYDYENKKIIQLENGLAYFLNDKNEAILTRGTNPIKITGEMVVPSEIDGHPVVGVGNQAFYKCEFGYMILPNSIKEIHSAAFARARFDYLKLPDELNYLGDIFFGSNLFTKLYEENDLPLINDNRVVSMPYVIKKLNYLVLSSGWYSITLNQRLLKTIKKSEIDDVTPLDIRFCKDYLTTYYLYERNGKEEACIFSCNHLEGNKIDLPNELDGYNVTGIDIFALRCFNKNFCIYNLENILEKYKYPNEEVAELSAYILPGIGLINRDYKYYNTDFKLTLPDSIKAVKSAYYSSCSSFIYTKNINFKLNNCLEEIECVNFSDPYFLPETVQKLTNVRGSLKTIRKEDEISIFGESSFLYIDFNADRYKNNEFCNYEVLESKQKRYIAVNSITPSNDKVIIPFEIDGIQVKEITLLSDEEFSNLYCGGLAPLHSDDYWTEEYKFSNELDFEIKNAFFDFSVNTIESLEALPNGIENIFVQEGLEEIRKKISNDDVYNNDSNKNTIIMNFKIYFDINHDAILAKYETIKNSGRKISLEEYIQELSNEYYKGNKQQWRYKTLHLPRSLKYINNLPPIFQKVYISKNTKIDDVAANFIFYDDEGNNDEFDIVYHDGTLKSEFVKK